MLNLGKELRAKLDQFYLITHPEIVEEQVSKDGTRKWLLRFPPRGAGAPVEIETVYIPETDRGTLCVSSQVGCFVDLYVLPYRGHKKWFATFKRMRFLARLCSLGTGLQTSLAWTPVPGMIAPLEGRKISNIVMMGMGEPLFNFENVKSALLIALDGDGLCFSPKTNHIVDIGRCPGDLPDR